jgi:trimethylamine---corrinoid protein Co-methyltransferase
MKLTEWKVLTQEEIEMIHESSLDVLENCGVVVEDEEVLQLLERNGCSTDHQTMITKFPRETVRKALSSCPASFPVLDRNGREAFILGKGNCKCGSGHNAVFTLVDESGERREATLEDARRFSILSDVLSEVDIISIPYSPQDVNPKTSLLYAIKQILDVSEKPIFFSCESEIINEAAVEMAKAALGVESLDGRSNMITQLSTTSPLYWERGAVKALHLVAKAGMPVAFLPQPITGVTAPYTLAGLLTVHNAEVLSGIVISQLTNPGLPVIYASAWTTYEMKQTNVLLGRPESSLLRIAGAQVAHFYKIPCHTTAPDNDSNLHDEQGAWEKMLSTIAAMSGGNDMLVNLGMFGSGMSITCEQLVLDNEMCRIARRMMKGIEVNEDTIAIDVIKEVGPRNMFIMEDHTMMHLRTGEHVPLDVSNGANFGVWSEKGKISSVDAARSFIEKTLKDGARHPLDEQKSGKLAEIIRQCETRFS